MVATVAAATVVFGVDPGRTDPVADADAQAQVTAVRAEAAASTEIVGQTAAQLYRSPTPGLLLLSCSASEVDIADLFAVHTNLAQLGDRQNGQVRQAIADRVRLQSDQVVIRELADPVSA